MKPLIFCAITMSLLLTASCGKKNLALPEDDLTRSKTGICGTEVTADYQMLVERCEILKERRERRECKLTAQAFIAKYPDIHCELPAEESEASGKSDAQSEPTLVTAEQIEKIISGLRIL